MRHPFRVLSVLPALMALLLLPACDDDGVSPDVGSVRLETLPAALDVSWTLTGPDGYLAVGTGDKLLRGLPVGDYAVAWTPRAGWIAGADSTAALEVGAELCFRAEYRERLPLAGTPQQLVANFRTVYEAMDSAGYRELLAPDFRMFLGAETIQEWSFGFDSFDAVQSGSIHDRMFSGQPGATSLGYPIAPLTAVAVSLLEQEAAWALSASTAPVPEALSAPYMWRTYFYDESQHAYESSGRLVFYAAALDTVHLGIERQIYQLLGVQDLTGMDKAVEEMPLGFLLSLWFVASPEGLGDRS